MDDFFRGDGEGDVRSWYCRNFCRPVGELRRASCDDRGGHLIPKIPNQQQVPSHISRSILVDIVVREYVVET